MSTMAKSKTQKNRQQRQVERRKARKEAAPFPRPKGIKGKGRKRPLLPPGLDKFTDDDMLFWLTHGANYIASDYDEGVWDPIMEGIYEEGSAQVAPDQLVQTVAARYGINEDEDLSETGQAVLGWTVQDKVTIYLFSREVERAVEVADPDCEDLQEASRQPADPVVWGVFHGIKKMLGGLS